MTLILFHQFWNLIFQKQSELWILHYEQWHLPLYSSERHPHFGVSRSARARLRNSNYAFWIVLQEEAVKIWDIYWILYWIAIGTIHRVWFEYFESAEEKKHSKSEGTTFLRKVLSACRSLTLFIALTVPLSCSWNIFNTISELLRGIAIP